MDFGKELIDVLKASKEEELYTKGAKEYNERLNYMYSMWVKGLLTAREFTIAAVQEERKFTKRKQK